MRNQATKDAFDVSAGDQQEDEVQDNRDNSEELSLSRLSAVTSRGKRKQERATKSRPNEMTEEEMIDLALRLSEQEASVVAIRRQKEEEEAMMKAIHESMSLQDQPCPSESQSLLDETDAPSMIRTRRKLTYSNGRSTSAVSQGPSGGGCTSNNNQKRGTKRSTDESMTSRKRKRKEGSPLLEMPDLSQTQKIYSQTSPSSSHVLELQLDSMQSSDSTQIGERPHRKSPVFPSSYRKAMVHVPRLCQDLVQSCMSSGFVWSSQDSSPLRSLPADCRSPTFPRSPERSSQHVSRKSPVLSESSREDDGESTPEDCRSPVFAGNSQPGGCPSPCRVQVHNCNSGSMLSSQERTASCRPQSPVFPKSPAEIPATRKSPGSSDSCEGEAEHLRGRSPVFGGTERLPQTRLEVQKHSIREDVRAVLGHPVGLNQLSVSGHSGEKLEDTSRNAEQQLSSNMTLLWSDEDDDLTQVDSPSPVFPEEGPVHRAGEQPASLNQPPGGSPGPSASTRSRGESISRRETVSRLPARAGSSTVHYYWGVPFCPRGLHPDSYTQVILAQMEVYEKSLKRAQRRLLRKAEWGEAIVPQPEKSPESTHLSPADSPQEDFSQRRFVRLRSNKLCDAAGSPAAAEEEEGEAEDEQTEERCQEEGGQMDADDCHVCPETQLSDMEDDRTQDVIVVAEAAAHLPPTSPELLDVDMILRDDSPAVDAQLEEADTDALLDSNSEGGVSDRGRKEEEEEVELDVAADPGEAGDGGRRRSASPELDLAVMCPARETSVDCPICQRSFPMTQIEVHAAYCDGEETAADRRPKPDRHQASLKPRRKRPRKAGEEEATGSCSTAREKCYICQAVVPLRDYDRHTELCIQQQEAKVLQSPRTGVESYKITGFLTFQKENLLSALDKTESRDSEARPSGSKLQPGYVIDLLDDDDDDGGGGGAVEQEGDEGGVRVSNSPIRSFTPISEATDCLIDFRQQQRSRKLSRRRR